MFYFTLLEFTLLHFTYCIQHIALNSQTVKRYSSPEQDIPAMGHHLPYGITQYYLLASEVNAICLIPARQAGTRLTYPRGIKG